MENEEKQDVAQLKTPIDFVQRIKNLPLRQKPINYLKRDEEEFCVVCGVARINSDPTGLTCGQTRCLSGLWDWMEEKIKGSKNDIVEKLKGMAVDLGLDSKNLPDDLEEICKEITDKIDGPINTLISALEILGIPDEDIPDDLAMLTDKLFGLIREIVIAVNMAEEQKTG